MHIQRTLWTKENLDSGVPLVAGGQEHKRWDGRGGARKIICLGYASTPLPPQAENHTQTAVQARSTPLTLDRNGGGMLPCST